ncbi:hypothetical protein [uncultured Roseibium sp.]|uniref:hypothetical protein n=1 Tax=uncultured Roseibium sp. TaxID=1936171 RepID=UPI00321700A0
MAQSSLVADIGLTAAWAVLTLAVAVVALLVLYFALYSRAAEKAERDAIGDPDIADRAKAARQDLNPFGYPKRGNSW